MGTNAITDSAVYWISVVSVIPIMWSALPFCTWIIDGLSYFVKRIIVY
jgi:hypothetical protein